VRSTGPLTLDEALELLRARGVHVPDWVRFFIVENDDVDLIADPAVHAQYLSLRESPATRILWPRLLSSKTGRVPVKVRRRALDGEEWALAIFGHELFELNALYALFSNGSGSMTFATLARHIDPAGSANLHTQAWDEADRLVNEWRRSQT